MIVEKAAPSNYFVRVNFIIVILFNALLYYCKSQFSFESLKSIEYLVFVSQIVGYAMLTVLIIYLSEVNYYVIGTIISTDLILKGLNSYYPVDIGYLLLAYLLVLIVFGRYLLSKCDYNEWLVLLINTLFQSLILKEFIFFTDAYLPVYYLLSSGLLFIALYALPATRKHARKNQVE